MENTTTTKPQEKSQSPISERKKQRAILYNNKQWRALSLIYRSQHPICEKCNENLAEHVHHKLSPFDYGLSYSEKMHRLLDMDNLMSVCPKCHQLIHEEQEKKKKEWNRTEHLYIRY
jgi:5-methylcytosine-specific restriction endonuclease McrA